jgi:hypothetical protein
MALNVDTQDLVNYPGNNKRVSLDINSLVPTGYEGDEQIVMVVSTTAYSDNENRTAIQDLYITEAKSGWIKSSGFKGSVFQLDGTHTTFKIQLDSMATTGSGYNGTKWYDIVLEEEAGANLPGVTVAADIETKIRALPTDTGSYPGSQWNVGDAGFIMAFKNCSVEFENGKFKIISGSISDSYLGADKSSVAVASGTANDCLSLLGFDLDINSFDLASIQVKEAEVVTTFSGGSDTILYTSGGTGASIGDAMAIVGSDGVPEYFIIESFAPSSNDITITVDVAALSNTYLANAAKVQLLRVNDPEFEPVSAYGTVDSIGRYGLKNMINQIDYSS